MALAGRVGHAVHHPRPNAAHTHLTTMRLRSQQGRCAGASLSASSGRRAATQNGSLARTTAQQLRCVCSSAAQSSSGAHASCCSQLLASSGSAAAALAQKIATPQRSQWGSGAQRPRGVQARAQAQSVGTVVKQPGADKEVRWGSALSRATTLSEAMDEAVGSILGSIGRDSKPDLAIVFASSVHGEEFEQLVPMLRERVPSLRTVFGCSGYGVVGGSPAGPQEVEGEHAFSLALGQLPGVSQAKVQVLHTLRSSIPDSDASPEDWAGFVGVPHDARAPTSFMIFADPRFAQVRELVAGLDYAFPDSPKIGSILSSGTRSKSRAMWAWSASGPANASSASSSGRGAARGRRNGGLGLRMGGGGARGRGRGGSPGGGGGGGPGGGVSPQDMAAAVLAVMGGGSGGAAGAAADEAVARQQQRLLEQQQQQQGGAAADGSGSDGGGSASGQEQEDAEGPQGRGAASASSSPSPSGASELPDVIVLNGSSGEASSSSGGGVNGSAAGGRSQRGILGSLLGMLGGGAAGGAQAAGGPNGSAAGAGGEAGGVLRAVQDSFRAASSSAAASALQQQRAARQQAQQQQQQALDVPSNGMYLYGAIVMAIQGDVQLDVITSMGYRAPSPRIWRIEAVSGNDHIVTVVPEDVAAPGSLAEGGGLGGASLAGAAGASSGARQGRAGRGAGGRMASMGNSSDDSDEDSDDEEGAGEEVQALAVVVDMLDALTSGQAQALQQELGGMLKGEGGAGGAGGDEMAVARAMAQGMMGLDGVDDWEELLDTAVVAVAADNSKPASELRPEDWELMPLMEIVEEYGVLVVGNPPVVGGGPDLRRGNRIRLLVRDSQGVREDLRSSLLAYKRRDLAAMLTGRALPPTFGALLLTDVDRGMDCYEQPNYESGVIHQYVPTPISGVFGGAQVAPVASNGSSATAILEYAAVVGVLRAAPPAAAGHAKATAAAAAAAAEEGGGSSDAASPSPPPASSGDEGDEPPRSGTPAPSPSSS